MLTLMVALAICAALFLGAPPVRDALITMIGGAQPSAMLKDTIFTLVFFGALLIAGIIGAAFSRRNAFALGARPGRRAVGGALLGALGVVATTGYAWLAGGLGSAPTQGTAATIVWGTALVMLETSAEEVYFRGWLQPALGARWGSVPAVAVAAIAFAALHILGGTRDPVSVINLFLGGLLFGVLAWRSGGIAGAVAAHFAWNAIEEMVLGLSPNPGIGTFGAIYNFELNGRRLWGGSEEGLNGSVAMTIALVALLVALVLLFRDDAGAKAANSAIV